MKIFNTLNILFLIVLFTNCNETKKVIEDTGSNKITGTYVVTVLSDTKITKDKGLSIEMSELNKTIRGTTGCNSFFGTILKEGQSLRVTEVNISENYCDDGVMKLEQSLMQALNAATSYMMKDQVLTLYSDPDHNVLLNAVLDTKE